jgi:hypothetical protein
VGLCDLIGTRVRGEALIAADFDSSIRLGWLKARDRAQPRHPGRMHGSDDRGIRGGACQAAANTVRGRGSAQNLKEKAGPWRGSR